MNRQTSFDHAFLGENFDNELGGIHAAEMILVLRKEKRTRKYALRSLEWS